MKNGKQIDWEARFERLEKEVQEIKTLLRAQQHQQGWQAILGAFEGDPIFEEITKLGLKVREKERKSVRRTRTKGKA